MSDWTWSVIEMLGHRLLAWSVVVGLIAVWLKPARPRRAAVRYAAWLLATFAGLALVPVVIEIGPRTSWREILIAMRRESVAFQESPASFRSWFDELPSSAGPRPLDTNVRPVPDLALADGSTKLARQRVFNRPAEPDKTAGNRWLLIALSIWAAGVALFTTQLIWSAFQVRAFLTRLDRSAISQLEVELEKLRMDLAAGKLETPDRYATWLLDLAPVSVTPPVLVSSLGFGPSQLPDFSEVW